MPTLPTPIEAEALAMPADHGFGLDDVEGSAPARPDVAEDIPEGAVLPAENWPERIAL